MTRTSISPGVYVDGLGRFWGRPVIRGRSTWRLLKAVTQRAAVKEYSNTDYAAPAGNFASLAELYVKSGCPDKKLKPRPEPFTTAEKARVTRLASFFGNLPAADLRLDDCLRYHKWRIRSIRYGTGGRTVDKDLNTLSNVLNYATARRLIPLNYIRAGRPKFQEHVRHSREVAPVSADVIHRLADEMFGTVRTEVLAWQLLFAMFTGCRTSELLRLRLDARDAHAAGFIQWKSQTPDPGPQTPDGRLSLQRSKKGVNPFAIIGPEFAQMIDCFRRWHAARFPDVPWFFPSPVGKLTKEGAFATSVLAAVDLGALGHALTRFTAALDLPHITPHGLRSFYVTKRRSDGAPDAVIAGEIGDKTVSLMQSTYGDRPDNWTGGTALSWLPSVGLPAWQRWQAAESKVVAL
jgi:integrase